MEEALSRVSKVPVVMLYSPAAGSSTAACCEELARYESWFARHAEALDFGVVVARSPADLLWLFSPKCGCVLVLPNQAAMAELRLPLSECPVCLYLAVPQDWDGEDLTADWIAAANRRVLAAFATQMQQSWTPFASFFVAAHDVAREDKMSRMVLSLRWQTCPLAWECVIVVDDGPDSADMAYACALTRGDPRFRVRCMGGDGHTGSIGAVKREASSLCAGYFAVELDADDMVVPDLVAKLMAVHAAEAGAPEGPFDFVYGDAAGVWLPGPRNQSYGDDAGFGLAGYYAQDICGIKAAGAAAAAKSNADVSQWLPDSVLVHVTPPVGDRTLAHLVAMPNHPRIWRREFLLSAAMRGGYNAQLPVADDYDLLRRTYLHANRIGKIPELCYFQFFGATESLVPAGRNTSVARNRDIQRLVAALAPTYPPVETQIRFPVPSDQVVPAVQWSEVIWLRGGGELEPVLVRGLDALLRLCGADGRLPPNLGPLVVLDHGAWASRGTHQHHRLERELRDRVAGGATSGRAAARWYVVPSLEPQDLEDYFYTRIAPWMACPEETSDTLVPRRWQLSEATQTRAQFIQMHMDATGDYLEIGVESGGTFAAVVCAGSKTGVDPVVAASAEAAAAADDGRVTLAQMRSDDWFANCCCVGDAVARPLLVFIDGDHDVGQAWRDLCHALCLRSNAVAAAALITVVLDDVLPIDEREQRARRPAPDETWTGRVWCVLYYLLLNRGRLLDVARCFVSRSALHRGMAALRFSPAGVAELTRCGLAGSCDCPDALHLMDYFRDYDDYGRLLIECDLLL